MEPLACSEIFDRLEKDPNFRDSQNIPKIKVVTTDRSTAIKAVMKKKNQLRQQAKEPECKHGADLWHYDKNITTDLRKLCKAKYARPLRPWIPSLRRFIYWSPQSSRGMPKGTIAEKLMSMVDHIQNVHEFPQNKHFKRCSHGMPAPSRLKYIAKNSILLTKLRDIISGKNNSRINDANSLEECGQTGLNETLNSLHNMYAPKYLGLTHQTMIIKG